MQMFRLVVIHAMMLVLWHLQFHLFI